MRACASDTASRLCVRTVAGWSAFSLVPPLGSACSSAPPPLRSQASLLLWASPTPLVRSSSASASGLPGAVLAKLRKDGPEISRLPSGHGARRQPGRRLYKTRPMSAADLKIMRRLDELHLDYPFAGSRMLRDFLNREGVSIGRRHVTSLMKRMGISAISAVRTRANPRPATRSTPTCCAG